MIKLKGQIVITWKTGTNWEVFLILLRVNFPDSGLGTKYKISVYKDGFIGSIKEGGSILLTPCGKYIILPKSCF